MELLTADYLILAASSVGFVLGLFIGFSGALAFLIGCISAGLAVRFGWSLSAEWISVDWLRALVTFLAALLAFGLVRLVTKKTVHGLVAQPGDAIFGALIAAVTGFVLVAGGLWMVRAFGFAGDSLNSVLLEKALSCVGG